MKKRTFTAVWVALVIALGAPAAWALPAQPEALANANTVADGESQSAIDIAQADAVCPFGWAAGTESHAYAGISTAAYGLSKAWCRLTAHDPFEFIPYPDNYLSGGADTETIMPFRVVSTIHTPGTVVPVTLQLGVHGTLQVLEGVLNASSKAYASCLLELKDGGGTFLASRDGDATLIGSLTGEGYTFATDVAGDWVGHLTPSVDGSGKPIYLLDYVDTMNFNAVIGDAYSIYLDVATSVWSSPLRKTDPVTFYPTFAQSDFWNTGEYQLAGPEGVGFEILPEPASLALLALGVAGLACRRRRR